jgi:hypothetical protein
MVGKLNLYVKNKLNIYHICRIGIDPKLFDIYYHILINTKGKTIYNEIANRTDLNVVPDHISFHHDGTVHYRNKRNKIRPKDIVAKKDCSIFDTDLNGHRTYPFLINSISTNALDSLYNKEEMPNDIGNFLWDVTGLGYFSVICLSINTNINVQYILGSLGFFNDFKILPVQVYLDFENQTNSLAICLGAIRIKNSLERFSYDPRFSLDLFPNLNDKSLYQTHP